jgi:calcium-dependent protein kinase
MGCAPVSPKKSLKTLKTKRKTSFSQLLIAPGTFIKLNENKFSKEYAIEENLKSESLIEIKLCRSIKLGEIRTVKIFKKNSEKNEELRSKFLNEANIIKILDHPNIIKVYEFFEDPNNYYLVSEYIKKQLSDDINDFTKWSELKYAQIIRQLFSCLLYMHSNNIVHRNLKIENLLYQNINDSVHIKIVDFSDAVNTSESYMDGKLPPSVYNAPEILQGNYSEKIDLWSVGIILFYLVNGRLPENINIIESIEKNNIVWAKKVSDELIDLLKHLLVAEKYRYTAIEALNSPWIKSNNIVHINKRELSHTLFNISKYEKKHKLKDAIMAYITTKILDTEDLKLATQIFKVLDSDGDGKISKEELIEGYSKVMDKKNAISTIDSIMKHIDTEDTGFIKYSSFLKASIDKYKIISVNNLKAAFQMLDADQNGKISAMELKKALQGDEETDDVLWKKLIAEFDLDNDGGIDFYEFQQFLWGE